MLVCCVECDISGCSSLVPAGCLVIDRSLDRSMLACTRLCNNRLINREQALYNPKIGYRKTTRLNKHRVILQEVVHINNNMVVT